jgi:hypothetical protein
MARALDFRAPAPRSEDAYVEEYLLQGVECEVLHTTVAAWEHQMSIVLVELSPTSLAQKAISVDRTVRSQATRWTTRLVQGKR